jgi:hypothetical protein
VENLHDHQRTGENRARRPVLRNRTPPRSRRLPQIRLNPRLAARNSPPAERLHGRSGQAPLRRREHVSTNYPRASTKSSTGSSGAARSASLVRTHSGHIPSNKIHPTSPQAQTQNPRPRNQSQRRTAPHLVERRPQKSIQLNGADGHRASREPANRVLAEGGIREIDCR